MFLDIHFIMAKIIQHGEIDNMRTLICFGICIFLLCCESVLAEKLEEYPRVYPSHTDYSLVDANNYEINKQFDEADQLYAELQSDPYGAFLVAERLVLRSGKYAWADESIENVFDRFIQSVNNQTDIRDALPLTINCNKLETSAFFSLSNQDFAEILEKISISGYGIEGFFNFNHGSYFILNSFDLSNNVEKWYSGYKSLILFISKIDNSIFEDLNGKYEIEFCYFVDFEFEEEMIQYFNFTERELNFSKKLVYGIQTVF